MARSLLVRGNLKKKQDDNESQEINLLLLKNFSIISNLTNKNKIEENMIDEI